MQVEVEFGSGGIIFGRIMPLGLRKIPIMCHKNTQSGQVQMWFYLNDFQQCYAPSTYVS